MISTSSNVINKAKSLFRCWANHLLLSNFGFKSIACNNHTDRYHHSFHSIPLTARSISLKKKEIKKYHSNIPQCIRIGVRKNQGDCLQKSEQCAAVVTKF